MLKRTTLASALALVIAMPAYAQDSATENAEAPAAETPAVETPTKEMTKLTADSVVATVNGVDITLGAAIVARQALPAQYQQVPAEVLLPGLIDQLVDQEVLGQASDGISLGTQLYIENQERAAKAGEMVNKILQSEVDDEALQAEYDKQYADFEGDVEYSAAHILVETEEEAKELVTALEGGADFTELAKEKSTGPSGPNGGDLGWFGEGMMVEPFETALLTLEPGEISAPVQTQFGWHVIKMNDTRTAAAPELDEVREEMANAVREAMLTAKLDELKSEAKIDRIALEDVDPSVISDYSLIGE